VYQVIAYSAHKDVTRALSQLWPGSDSDHRPTAVILYPALPGDQVSDTARGLDLRAALRNGNVLQDFEFDILRIPVSLPILSFAGLQKAA